MIKDKIKEIAKENPKDVLLHTPDYVGKVLGALVNAVEELETKEALLDKALNLIVELCKDDDNICCALHEIPKENKYCAEHCDNFNKSCVLRYLKYNNKITKGNGSPAKR